MSVTDGKITKSMLKVASGEFDVKSIHSLVLRKSNLTDLGCIGECVGLERLDLSYNDVTKLQKLAGMSALQSLNLSANRISSLDGLQSLQNLRSLNLAGNLIGSVDNLRCLCGLEHIKELRLKDEGRELSNPACMLPSYATDVINMFPALMVLDGWGEQKEISVPLVDLSRQPSNLWHLPDRLATTSHNKAEEQLKDLLTSCHHLSIRAAERLEELKLSTPATDTKMPDAPIETAVHS